jgi:thioredoxin reductase (NADPH)
MICPMSHTHTTTDVVLVGAGPIGIEMAVALKKAGVDYVHVEAGQVGQTMTWWAPGTRFFSSNERIAIAGVPLVTPDQGKASREVYLAYLRTVVTMYDLPVRTFEKVVGIEPSGGDGFTIATSRRGLRRTIACNRLILATGGTDRPRKLGVPGEDLPHVSPWFNEPHTYFRQNLLIVGGKNSAAEAALRCHHAGAKVAISYRREQLPEKHIKYWIWPELRGYINSGAIAAHLHTQPVAITPSHVTLRHLADNSTFDVPADFVLLLIGYEQDNALLKCAGVELTGPELKPTFDPATMQTNVPGVYVIGTATGGTQSGFTVFIENCHTQVERVVGALTGRRVRAGDVCYAQPES